MEQEGGLEVTLDRIVRVSEFKRNPARYLDEVRRGRPVTITQGRKAECIVLPRERWAQVLARLEELEEELETLQLMLEPRVQRRLAEGLPERGISLDEARRILGLEPGGA